jgi:hypothetical protein
VNYFPRTSSATRVVDDGTRPENLRTTIARKLAAMPAVDGQGRDLPPNEADPTTAPVAGGQS